MQGIMAAASFPPSTLVGKLLTLYRIATPQTPTKVVPEMKKRKVAKLCMVCGAQVVSMRIGYYTKGYTAKGKKSQTLEERVKVIVETGPETEDHTLHSDYMCKQCFRMMVKLEKMLKEQQQLQTSFVARYWDSRRRQHESTKVSLTPALTPTRMKRMFGSPGAGIKRPVQNAARPATASGAGISLTTTTTSLRRQSLAKEMHHESKTKPKVIMK